MTSAFQAAASEIGAEVNADDDVQANAVASSCAYARPDRCGNMGRIESGGNLRTGFKWVAYRDISGEGPLRVALAGTDDLADAVADGSQALGLSTAQYKAAQRVARSLKASYGDNIVFVGHSLGGGLAAAAARATALSAMTFNAAGLSKRYGGGASGPGSITAYSSRTDALSLFQDALPGVWNAAGTRRFVRGGGLHGIAGMCSALGADC